MKTTRQRGRNGDRETERKREREIDTNLCKQRSTNRVDIDQECDGALQEENCDQVNTPLYQMKVELLRTVPTLSLSFSLSRFPSLPLSRLSSSSLSTESRPSVNTYSPHTQTHTHTFTWTTKNRKAHPTCGNIQVIRKFTQIREYSGKY